MLATIKAVLQVMLILICIGVTVALAYFITIILGVAIVAVVIYICIKEYQREVPYGEETKEGE